MGIPESIDPPPQKIEIDWPVNAVAKPIQKKTGDIVSRPGEFGFLPQEGVDEISKQISENYCTNVRSSPNINRNY